MYQRIFDLHADLLKALAHPKRLELILLLRDGELTVSQMTEMLGLTQANVSQHLIVLRDLKVVKNRRSGKHIFYALTDINFVKACDLIREVLIKQHQNLDIKKELIHLTDQVKVVIDPICGMKLTPKTAAFGLKKNGKNYYFCGHGCMEKFSHRF